MILRNPNLKKEIRDELEYLNSKYFEFDIPVPFKEGLILYPIETRYYDEFVRVSSCFTMDKNETAEGLMTTHLGYLINKMEDKETGQFYTRFLARALELIFHVKGGILCECGHFLSYEEFLKIVQAGKAECPECHSTNLTETIRYINEQDTKKKKLIVNGIEINSKDFDRLRQIVIYQNFPDYQDDSWVDPEVRADQKLKQEILAKQGSGGSATLEQKIVAVSSQSSYKFNEIYDMPMRKFIILLQMIDNVITYQCDRTGLMSGMVTMKKPLEHLLYKPQKSMYGTATTAEAYKGEIAKANG